MHLTALLISMPDFPLQKIMKELLIPVSFIEMQLNYDCFRNVS